MNLINGNGEVGRKLSRIFVVVVATLAISVLTSGLQLWDRQGVQRRLSERERFGVIVAQQQAAIQEWRLELIKRLGSIESKVDRLERSAAERN